MSESHIEDLQWRLAQDPSSRLFAQLAEEHRRAGDSTEAIRVVRAGLLHHPVYPSARLTLGRALLDTGDAAGARGELAEALRQAPENIQARRFLGQALEAVGDLEGALAQYGQTLKLAPGDRELEVRVRELKARLSVPASPRGAQEAPAALPASDITGGDGTPEDARGEGGATGPVAGSLPFISATLGELYLRQGLAERAAAVYRQVVARQPNDTRARNRLAEIESLARMQADATDEKRRALVRTIAGLEALLGAVRGR